MALEYRRFGPPTLFSLGLHGLVVVGLGVFPTAAPVAPLALPILQVEIVQESETAAAAPAPAPAARAVPKSINKHPLKGRQLVLKKVARAVPLRAVAPAAPAPARFTPLVPVAHVPAQKTAVAAKPVVLEASAAESAARPAVFSLLESAGATTLGLPVAGAVSVSRPLPSAEGAARMLKDTVASGAPGRTRVRMGNNPRPDYPRLAREAGWEGTVVLLVEVLPDGTAGTILLHKSSGHPVLDEAASVAVQEWRFWPAMDGSFPIMSVVQLPVRFDLKSAQAN